MSTEAAKAAAAAPTSDNATEQPPARRMSKPLLLGMIAAILVLALTLGLAWLLHRNSTSAMREEIVLLKKQIEEKEKGLTEAQSQVANLSLQMKALREYAVARSSDSVKTKQEETAESKPAGESPPAEASTSKKSGARETTAAHGNEETASENTSAPASPKDGARPVEKKAKKTPTNQTCDLVGKSPEEQAAILKRCVELID